MIRTPRISVCIPTYEMNGHGCNFLNQSLEVLESQTFKNFEVVVSDQSEDDEIKDLCHKKWNMNLRYYSTKQLKKNASANTNAAIDASRGKIVKILFQDDFLLGPDALMKISNTFDETCAKWVLTGSAHTFDGRALFKPFIPEYHNLIHYGKNTVSSPSVLAFLKEDAPKFNEALVWLMDVDFYKKCELAWGHPAVLPEPLVVNRIHGDQVSKKIESKIIREEISIVRSIYRGGESWRDWCHYLGRLRRTYF